MRHLTLVGAIRNPKVITISHQCAWCRRWSSPADYIAAHKHNAKVSHTICKSCSAKFLAQLDAMPTPPPNAA